MAVTNVEAKSEIRSFKVEERTESDHLPLTIGLYRQKRIEKEKWRDGRRKEFGRKDSICRRKREI